MRNGGCACLVKEDNNTRTNQIVVPRLVQSDAHMIRPLHTTARLAEEVHGEENEWQRDQRAEDADEELQDACLFKIR